MEGLLYCSLSLCVVNIGQPTMPSWRLGRKLATIYLFRVLSALSLFSDLLGVAEERALGAEVGKLYVLFRVRLLQKVVIQMCRLLLRLACATDAF